MRVVEWLLVLGTLAALATLAPLRWQVRGRWRAPLGYAVSGAVSLFLLLHLFIEGARWQLTLVYVIAAGIALTYLRHPLLSRSPPTQASLSGRGARLLSRTAAGLVIASGVTAWALPVPQIPRPSGDFSVGTRSFMVTDVSRPEEWSEAEDDVREFPVQIWYPVAPGTEGQLAPWSIRPQAVARQAARWLGLPGFVLDHLSLVETNAIANAPLADGDRFPVVVYVHGWGGFRQQHVTLLERLAANGYVVLSADHTYGALSAVFPDGRTEPLNPQVLPADAPSPRYDAAASRLVATYAGDLEILVEELRAGSAALPFPLERLDLDRVAVVGHSAGGGAGLLTCSRVRWCATLVAFDPWVEPLPDEIVAAGLNVPIVSVRSAEWIGNPNDEPLRRILAASENSRLLTITGSLHRDFTLTSMLTPIPRQLGLTADTGGDRVRQIVEELTQAWLEEYLLGEPSPLLAGEPSWPEVTE